MSDTSEAARLREQPKERFGRQENVFDLAGAVRDLRAEGSAVRHGHRQITLDQCGPVTLILFAFEAGGTLNKHEASGVVTIQGLEGELIVRTESTEYKLLPNVVVMIAPSVPHSVFATKAGAMLLSVCLTNSVDAG